MNLTQKNGCFQCFPLFSEQTPPYSQNRSFQFDYLPKIDPPILQPCLEKWAVIIYANSSL